MTAALAVDWPALLGELAWLLGDAVPGAEHTRTPLGTRLLADHLEVKRTTLRGWLEGSEPRHSDGEMLIGHWCLLTGKGQTFVPRMRAQLSAAQTRG